jgi:ketosteroid isomerase-like protein
VNTEELLSLMVSFRRAYAKADREGLLAVVTDDFSWHQHTGTVSDVPTGRVLHGVDALLEEIAWRGEHWSDVTYNGLEERAAGNLLVQTFSIMGIADGAPFAADAVDLYPVREGRIAMKDTYWKYARS